MSSFFAELKRRNVVKVGVAYAIVAWLLIQVSSTVLPTFNAPQWVLQTITFVIILGFPLTLIITWAFELTPEGVKPTRAVALAPAIAQAKSQRMNYIILGLLTLAVTFLLVDKSATVPSVTENGAAVTTVPDSTASADTQSSSPAASASSASSLQVRRHYQILGRTRPLPPDNLNAYIALSPDGGRLVYVVNSEGKPRIYVRELDTLTTRAISSTEVPRHIFLSPDGEWAGFTSQGGLYKISIISGTSQLLTQKLTPNRGGYWGSNGVIYYIRDQRLFRISANGGAPERVNTKSDLGMRHSWPSGLPDGDHLLLTVSQSFSLENANIEVLSLKTGETEILLRNAYHARYVPGGHLVFMRTGSLWAVPFNVTTMTTTGPEVPVVNGIQRSSTLGKAAYSFSDDGLLVYLPGENVWARGGGQQQLVWIDRQDNETPLAVKADYYTIPRLAPDAKHLAVVINNKESTDVWIYDITRNILSRRTFSGDVHAPLWTPDGVHLVYTFFPKYRGLAWVNADGTGQPESLLDAPRLLHPVSFTPDGTKLLYFEALTGPVDIYALTLTGERIEQPLLTTKFNEQHPALSPDGRWLAYASNETGIDEIYVRPYPNVGDGKWQVSTNGGVEPHWRGDGKELFYRHDQNPSTIMAVPVETGEKFQYGTATMLFRGDYYVDPSGISYDVTADGQRFLTLKAAEQTNGEGEGEAVFRETNLIVVDNWFEELKRLAPPAK